MRGGHDYYTKGVMGVITRIRIQDVAAGQVAIIETARETNYPPQVTVKGRDPDAVLAECQRLAGLIDAGSPIPAKHTDLDQ